MAALLCCHGRADLGKDRAADLQVEGTGRRGHERVVVDLGHVTETAVAMIEAGADLLDIGGESTRPGAEPVSGDEECRRVAPALERLLDLDVIVSIDTRKPQVARMAIQAGAHLINDVTGMTNPEMLEAVADSKVAVCLMHMQGDPGTMQEDPRYSDVVCEVRDFLALQSERCLSAGIGLDRLVLDPGFGFGKNIDHNLALLRDLPELRVRGLPLLVVSGIVIHMELIIKVVMLG